MFRLMKRGRKAKYSRDEFLEAMRSSSDVAEAARLLGLSTARVYQMVREFDLELDFPMVVRERKTNVLETSIV